MKNIKKQIPLRFAGRYLLAIAWICLAVSCTRDFLPLPDDETTSLPDGNRLQSGNDSLYLSNTINYINALEFALASKEVQQIADEHLRDSLKQRIAIIENFADNYLVYTINGQGRKRYIHNLDRVQEYNEKGYVEIVSEEPRLEFTKKQIPDNVIGLFNMEAYYQLKELKLPGAAIDFLNLSALNKLEVFHIQDTKAGLEIDLSQSAALNRVEIISGSNIRMKLHPDAIVGLKIQDSYFKNLSDLNIDKVKELSLKNVKLMDNELLKTQNPYLEKIDISVEGVSEKGSDGSTYHSLVFDNNFIAKINAAAPNLKSLSVTFANSELYQQADFSGLNLPLLEKFSIEIIDENPGASPFRSQTENFELSRCPKLKEFSLSGLYTREINLSQLTTAYNPELKQIRIVAATNKLYLPENSNEVQVNLALTRINEVIVPEAAKQKHSLLFFDFYKVKIGEAIADNIDLDWNYLRNLLKSVSGYMDPTPPSEFIPASDRETVVFNNKVLDFSGPQWKNFKGKVSFLHRLWSIDYTDIDYIDFGHLTEANFNTKTISVNVGCIVKNLPDGLIIKQISPY